MSRTPATLLVVLAAGACGFWLGRATAPASHQPQASTLGPTSDLSQPAVRAAGTSEFLENERRSMVPPEAGDSTAPVSANSGKVAAAEAPAQSSPAQSEDQKLLKRLEGDLQALDTASKADQYSAAQRLMCECIAIIMDKAGTSIPSPPGQHTLPQEKGSFVFLTNGRIYKFRHGEFPEYDAMMKVWDVPFTGGPKKPEEWGASGPAGVGQQPYELDADTIQLVKIRCAEVQALLGGAH